MRSKKKGEQPRNSHDVLKLIGSNIATLLAAYMMFASSDASNDTAMLATLLERQKTVEESNMMLIAKVMALGVENVKLQERLAEIKGELNQNLTRKNLYQAFLDSLPFPAWIKKKDKDGTFRMVMINNAYAHKFNKTKARYKNATDEEIWGKEVADGFKSADEEVFKSKGYLLTQELFPKNGRDSKATWHSVWKFSIMLGEEVYGVGGIVVVDFVSDTHINKDKAKK